MKINWKVRFANINFWLTIVPAILLLVKAVAALFGLTLELDGLSAQIVSVIEAVFLVLGILGIVNDPTTKGASDSEQAMTYEKPKG